MLSHDDIYLNLVKDILENGKERNERTGTGMISVFSRHLRFNISKQVPILTTKKMYWRSCVLELLWFLRGETNTKTLSAQGVKIWNANTTREFLDNRGLHHIPEGDMGPGYGFQWRHFGGNYGTETPGGFDQIKYILHELRTNPTSRRIFLSAWNPLQMKDMALPPCHVSAQFYVELPDNEGEQSELSCHFYQRSVDVFLGLPFNIASYTVLTYILASLCNMKPKELIVSTGDTHIYKNHIEQMREQLNRIPYYSPILKINPNIINKSIEEITIQDFDVLEYQHHPAISGKMSA